MTDMNTYYLVEIIAYQTSPESPMIDGLELENRVALAHYDTTDYEGEEAFTSMVYSEIARLVGVVNSHFKYRQIGMGNFVKNHDNTGYDGFRVEFTSGESVIFDLHEVNK